MADSHTAHGRCRACRGTGYSVLPPPGSPIDKVICEKCEGAGKREWSRITYTHTLGRKPSAGSSAAMQWGPRYREFHVDAWTEAHRVLRPGGLLAINVKDHYRNKVLVPVTDWHEQAAIAVGFESVDRIDVGTPGMGFGANGKLRADHESILILRKPTPEPEPEGASNEQ